MLNLPIETDSKEAIPAQFLPLYTEKDGKFAVTDGTKAIVEAVNGLNQALGKERGKKQVDLSLLSEFGASPEEIRKGVDQRIAEAGKSANESTEERLQKLREEVTLASRKEIEKVASERDAYKSHLESTIIDKEAICHISKHKGVPELLLPFVKQQTKVISEDGRFVTAIVDAKGERRYSPINAQPLTIEDLVLEMKANPIYGRVFESTAPNGGGMGPNAGKGGIGNKPMTPQEKMAAGLAARGA